MVALKNLNVKHKKTIEVEEYILSCYKSINYYTKGENKMLTLEQIKEKLAVMNIQKVSARSGVPAQTIYRLMRGQNPSYQTVEALGKYLDLI